MYVFFKLSNFLIKPIFWLSIVFTNVITNFELRFLCDYNIGVYDMFPYALILLVMMLGFMLYHMI